MDCFFRKFLISMKKLIEIEWAVACGKIVWLLFFFARFFFRHFQRYLLKPLQVYVHKGVHICCCHRCKSVLPKCSKDKCVLRVLSL